MMNYGKCIDGYNMVYLWTMDASSKSEHLFAYYILNNITIILIVPDSISIGRTFPPPQKKEDIYNNKYIVKIFFLGGGCTFCNHKYNLYYNLVALQRRTYQFFYFN